MAWTPDGAIVASSGDDAAVLWWHPRTGRPAGGRLAAARRRPLPGLLPGRAPARHRRRGRHAAVVGRRRRGSTVVAAAATARASLLAGAATDESAWARPTQIGTDFLAGCRTLDELDLSEAVLNPVQASTWPDGGNRIASYADSPVRAVRANLHAKGPPCEVMRENWSPRARCILSAEGGGLPPPLLHGPTGLLVVEMRVLSLGTCGSGSGPPERLSTGSTGPKYVLTCLAGVLRTEDALLSERRVADRSRSRMQRAGLGRRPP